MALGLWIGHFIAAFVLMFLVTRCVFYGLKKKRYSPAIAFFFGLTAAAFLTDDLLNFSAYFVALSILFYRDVREVGRK